MHVIDVLAAALPAFVAVFLAAYYFAEFRWGSDAEARRENIVFAAVLAGVAAALALIGVAADKTGDARRANASELGACRMAGINLVGTGRATLRHGAVGGRHT